ncbi:MAG: PHP domain-containing protein [Clostridiaceae bacterium]|nr:PHP domain-containing protein [Eubacteriales bacterium]
MKPYDLHTHSYYSDGTDSPYELVKKAKEAGLGLVALTDHDTVAGVKEAAEAGKALGIGVLSAVEIDAQFPSELHILGYGVGIGHSSVEAHEKEAAARRVWRNEEIVKKLDAAGLNIRPYLEQSKGNGTRLHLARALMLAGYSDTVRNAFDAYLKPGGAGYVESVRPSPKRVIELIHEAGGLAVLAHPKKLNADAHAVVDALASLGLDGIEAYYPLSTEGEIALFLSLARQYGLFVTCGSDNHGAYRKNAELGSTWRDVRELEKTYEMLVERYGAAPG